MELWFSELHTPDVKMSIRVDKQIHSEQSEYQRIDVFESEEFGRFLTLDGIMMLTEKDEFIYHEMITHVAMASNPGIKNVLVIGAGDGGTVRELTRYESLDNIDMVEIDERVVEVCKQYLPKTACCLDDSRVHIFYDDGLRFVRRHENEYDLIIVDSTDPFGPARGFSPASFTATASTLLLRTAFSSTSTRALITPTTRKPCSGRTDVSASFLTFAGSIRRIYPHTLRDTGFSALLQSLWIPFRPMLKNGTLRD